MKQRHSKLKRKTVYQIRTVRSLAKQKRLYPFGINSAKLKTRIFVNLPVKDLNRSVSFFTKLGFTFNPQFTDENATCMIVGEDIFVMLLVEKFFKSFTSKEICETSRCTEAILALSVESREQVDQLMKKVIDSGGSEHGKTGPWMDVRARL